MWSKSCAAPYLMPLRANIRCGALLMLSMPPATTTLALPAGQHVVREHRRAHAAAAHLAQRHRAGSVGQTGAAQGLARRRLALTGHQAVAEQHFVDGVAGHAGALDGGLDGHGAQLPGGQGGEVAEQAADGRARGGDDDDGISHGGLLFRGGSDNQAVTRCVKRLAAS